MTETALSTVVQFSHIATQTKIKQAGQAVSAKEGISATGNALSSVFLFNI
jgi:hypothetical protein